MIRKVSLCVAIVTVLITGPVSRSHDYIDGSKAYKWKPARAAHMPVDPILRAAPRATMPVQYIVVLPNRWAIGQTLRICFFGGSDQTRATILHAAALWLPYANLKFDSGGANGRSCADQDKSEIRIGFSEPGYWSYIGTDGIAADLVTKNLSSMNFQGFDQSLPAEPRLTGIVLHEFGHALGFHHEHQSPADGCDKEYNWPKLYAFYLSSYNWDKTLVDQNVRQLIADRRAYDWSPPDRLSIMAYASDPQFLLKGAASPCYFKENDVLSQVDKQGAEKTYPSTGVAQALKDQQTQLEFLSKHSDKFLAPILATQLELTKAQLQKVQ
jgi:hypothetical protein